MSLLLYIKPRRLFSRSTCQTMCTPAKFCSLSVLQIKNGNRIYEKDNRKKR